EGAWKVSRSDGRACWDKSRAPGQVAADAPTRCSSAGYQVQGDWSRALQIERTGVELPDHDMSLTDSIGVYPEREADRARWILARRGGRNSLDPVKPYGFLVEEERAETGEVVSVATIFLTNRECPWRCLMCDLWRNTLTETVPVGAIPAQIDYALAQWRAGVTPALKTPQDQERIGRSDTVEHCSSSQ